MVVPDFFHIRTMICLSGMRQESPERKGSILSGNLQDGIYT